jgi:hypothetical protein
MPIARSCLVVTPAKAGTRDRRDTERSRTRSDDASKAAGRAALLNKVK